MQVITCEPEHIPALCQAFKEFTLESEWGFTLDYYVCASQFYDYMHDDTATVLGVVKEGKIAGVSIVMAQKDFCADMQGFLQKFYIRKPYRKTRAAFLLAEATAKWFDDRGCVQSFATSTSGIPGAICTFTKLMRKYGFKECGPTLARGLHGKV